jgi:hypothetical protein
MIEYIKYTIDSKTYSLIQTSDNLWEYSAVAPSITGNYNLTFEIKENGIVTYIDSSDYRYSMYLQIVENVERTSNLIDELPKYYKSLEEIIELCATEDIEFDEFSHELNKLKSDMFISTASNDRITELETFFALKGMGTLEQRKTYLTSLFSRGIKLNKTQIKHVVNQITGSDSVVLFFGSDELNNPQPGYGLIRVQVLSPDNTKDYRYDDIYRNLKSLVPSHLKLIVVKYFALWEDINVNFLDWEAVKAFPNWEAVKNYIPPIL